MAKKVVRDRGTFQHQIFAQYILRYYPLCVNAPCLKSANRGKMSASEKVSEEYRLNRGFPWRIESFVDEWWIHTTRETVTEAIILLYNRNREVESIGETAG